MEPQSAVENQSKRHSTKAKTNRKKSKLKEIIEKALLEDDSSFTRQISSENFADDIASVDSVKDQMTSESQTADSAYHSCHSNDNTNLTESASRYSVDGMNSSETSSCSSFAANSRSGKNPKKVRADRKKSFAKIISQTLGDSLNLDVDIPVEDETARQQPGISDQKPMRNLMEAKADVIDTWKSSMSKARSVTKKEIVSAEGGYALCSKETGKRNVIFSSKSDTSKKAVREGRIESFLNSLKVQDVSEIETTYPLDSKILLLGKKEVVKKPVSDVGAPKGMLESFFNNLKAQHASKIETTYPLDSKSLVLGKKEIVKKSVTDAYASYDFPDAIPSSCGIKTPLQIRPFGCFEQKHVSLTSKNVSSASKDVSSASKNVSSTSKDVLSASKDVLSASKDVSSASKNVSLTSKDVLSASKTVLSASKDVLLASKVVSSASKNVSLTSKASKIVLSASKDVSLATKDVSSASKDVLSATKDVSLASKNVLSASKDVSSASKNVSLATKDVSSATKAVSLASKDVLSASKDVSSATKDVSSAAKDVSLASNGVSSASKNDSLECSVDRSFTDASVQVDLCDCPRLIGFHCSTNISTSSSQQNLSRSERNCENLNSGDQFFASGNPLSETTDTKCIVPASPCIIYSKTEANKMVASHPKDVTCNSVKANNKSICSREEASSDNLSQMFSRIGLSDSLKNLPDDALVCAVPEKHHEELLETDECDPDSNDSANITDEKTESKVLDGDESTEDNVSPERLDISLQVSFASDGVTDESFSRENLVDEIAASDVVVDLCDDSVASGAAFGSDQTILYDVTDSETTDESLFSDKVRKSESADNVDRVSVDYIKTEADEWEGSESATRVDESRGRDLKTKADEADSADEDMSIHNLETDFRSISLQISLSSDDVSDKSDAADCLESGQSKKLDKLLKEDKNASVLNDDDDKSTSVFSDRSDKRVSILNDDDDKNASVVSDRDDLIIPESPQLSSDALSPSSAAEDGEEIEQVRNERRVIISIDTPSGHSFNCSVSNISLQVSLSSGSFSDTPADDLRMAEDYDRKDLDHKPLDLKEIMSPKESSLHQNPSAPQLPRNSNSKNCLFDMSDEEQSPVILPDDSHLADHSEVPGRVLCSTFLGRPSLESVRRADVNWITSPVETENLSPDLRKLKSIRRVSLLASNKESTSDSYLSADGASLMVPDTSESDTERGMLYKTAYVECDGEEEFVADSSESPVHKSRRKKRHATEVINVSNSMSSDDDFENFLGRVKTTEKVKKSPPPALDDFIVDDSEGEEEGDHEEDDEREACDDDVISDDNDENDARVFYYQVDNKREEQNVDALSNRLEKALNFSLTSDSSDDDFQKVLPKRKDIPKKSGKIMFPSEDDDAKATPEAAADKEDAGIFRTPAPVISKKRILSVIAPKVSSNSTLFDKRQAPYTVGHAAPPRYSFLKSLSSDVKEFLRDAKAARFVKSFKSLKKELTAELFTLYNREVFDSKIPSDMNIIWNDRLRRTAGFCRSRLTRDDPPKRLAQVELSVKVCDSPDRLRDTLIHEMCHAIVWLEHGSREVHGPIWKFWARKANRALADLPPITRCHSYDINTKYIYKCTKCGYEIGRHSKSLDTEKKICGHCRGQFELLVRPRNGSRTESAPSTPRTPNKFALYVKENYGDIKRTRPGVTHKEIMGVIGAQYSAKKAMLGDDRRVELIE